MKAFVLTLCVLLAACGGGGDAGPTAAPAAAPSATPAQAAAPAVTYGSLRVIGNSLTLHWPLPDSGWKGNWGMAASSADKDFAHLTSAALGAPLTAFNFSGIEYRTPEFIGSIPEVVGGIDANTAVVVQLGDNAYHGEFENGYGKLLDAVKVAKRLACTTTWWKAPARDDIIRRQCVAHGGTVVEIGDIFKGRLGLYPLDASVDSHPGDVAMAEIARRVVAALKAKS